MKVLFFAQCREIAGCDSCQIQADLPITQSRFWALLIEARPGLAAHQNTSRLARNETYVLADELLYPGDEIVVIPPVSGG